MKDEVPNLKDFDQRLRDEAQEDPTLEVPQGEPTSKTQIIAIYGKGGIGKILHAGQPQPHDGRAGQARAADRLRSEIRHHVAAVRRQGLSDDHRDLDAKKLAGEEVKIGDVCFKRGGVFAMELGGPEVGRGCGGRGIIHGFELLEKLGFHDWDFDYVLLDFLGDVVCGGFGLPIARDMAQKVILVASNDLQSLYVANNVCSAVEYFPQAGRQCRRRWAGDQQGRRHGRGGRPLPRRSTSRCSPRSRRTMICARNQRITRSSAPWTAQWGALFAALGDAVAIAPPVRPTPLDQDGLLGLFDAKDTGGDYELVPATDMDMRGKIRAQVA